ncbi:hypothetical protein [Streptomyces sp. NEAU-S7GS2]|uniref:hypothetical protein n=1 Tax=Streptomyces sp. NEAU-S7GS2 TaxID=2202000 RepID=UPI000D6EFEB7|nr:hypothetical protein [Streptomyces sp. NEAU-S7GS2]AWN24814.1 hypothetical protein DKG71_00240 [Streptomyces sp. NEAU-S7GS2]
MSLVEPQPPRPPKDWMDRDNEMLDLASASGVRQQPDAARRLQSLRAGNMDIVLRGIEARSRMPRVALYTLAEPGPETEAQHSALAQFAGRRFWLPDGLFSDAKATHPEYRTGWSLLRAHLRSGFADGVVALSRDSISSNDAEYERQLRLVGEYRHFIALVHTETGRA